MGKDPVFIDSKSIDKLVVELKGFETEVAEATYHALNRTLDYIVTKTGQLVIKEYAIKSREVKDSFRRGIKKPTRSNLSAKLISKGHTLSLAHFPHSPKTIGKRRRSKVKVKIKKSGGRKEVKTSPKAFLAPTGTMSFEKIQYNIFKRQGKGRLPIKVIRTLSIPQMITNDKIGKSIQDAAIKKLDERLEHEVTRHIMNIGKKMGR